MNEWVSDCIRVVFEGQLQRPLTRLTAPSTPAEGSLTPLLKS